MRKRASELSLSSYVPGIDGLRAIAVLAVMVYHALPQALPGGFVGVDVFFVISGYVVSGSLSRDRSGTFREFTIAFYARRILRIFPALVACLVVTTLLTTMFVPRAWLSKANDLTGLWAFFGASNFALLRFNDGYFSPRIEFNPFSHTWSLGVEEQFYLLFPLIFFAWLRYRDYGGLKGFASTWALPLLLAGSIALSAWETSAHPERAFYLIFSRFWELAVGAALFQLHESRAVRTFSSRVAPIVATFGVTVVGFSLVFSNPSHFPFPWALVSVLGSALVIASVVGLPPETSLIHRLLASRLLVYIGRISYSLYLWHWPVYVIHRWTIGLESAFNLVFAVALTFALSILSYQFVEIPTRKSQGFLRVSNRRLVTGGLLAVALSFTGSFLIFELRSKISLSVTADEDVWYPSKRYDGQIDEDRRGRLGGRRLYVIGDSHAGAYRALIARLAAVDGLEFELENEGGCSAAGLVAPTVVGSTCAKWLEGVVSRLEQEGNAADVVFLSSLRVDRLSSEGLGASAVDTGPGDPPAGYDRLRLEALDEARELIRRLSSVTPHVILEAPKPIFPAPPFRCSDPFNASNPVCRGGLEVRRRDLIAHRSASMKSIRTLEREFDSLIVWDPFPILCPGEICSAFDGDRPLFFDGDHLSGHGNQVLYPPFASLLESIWEVSGRF